MFYAMMTYLFVRKGDRLSRLVALLMCLVGLQCVMALFFMARNPCAGGYLWNVQSAIDMTAVPFYAFILIELVRPGELTVRRMLLHEAPFVALPLIYIATGNCLVYYILLGWTALYGNYYMIWSLVQIPRYHRRLKEHFSYIENINLNWVRTILIAFYLLLGLWIMVNCATIHVKAELIYMLLAIVAWMTICYFLYKHEQVLDELEAEPVPAVIPALSELGAKIEQLLREEQVFLNPHLKVSDIARAVGTNRTYVSKYFNQEAGVSFYEYINALRIDYACTLLCQSSESVKTIARLSGFNSPQSFIRTFVKTKGMNPTQFRNRQ